ncbi:Lecithin:cholesterol acyltransferase [Paraburkholderia steynii]|uniref:Lecithin:cholesterol acyltransferase n=1 Tax=Paraburkholderia steynii TaxID=1245441 RepID=A0A7Z7BF05_9BURK|nr:hypothetical protein [Paraburkholderia steynii]SDI74393.1 Lecithin:cholesterol acyltransferase [Paraburkholderia steynii]
MAIIERIIQPAVADDGSVHYSSVMSPPDESIAVCPMVPDRVIPVIFVPGVMGSNLKAVSGSYAGKVIWLVNGPAGVAASWLFRGARTRKQKLDPDTTAVYGGGDIPKGTVESEEELRRRGWGTVGKMSYGTFLPWLENALNDAHIAKTGLRSQLMHDLVADASGVSTLTSEEVALSYRYRMPVHAVGYNWLQSNARSAKTLEARAREFAQYYRDQGLRCEKVIIVTHSMGGLVSRYFSEVMGNRESVLGIAHGVMPTTGSATAYKRVRSGSEGIAGLVLGPTAGTMTPVFAQSPGPLQLLPGTDYGMNWLQFIDGSGSSISLPKANPYTEIYLQRGKWWGLVVDRLINPFDEKSSNIDDDWGNYQKLIFNHVLTFHQQLQAKFHSTTYAFYGDDIAHATWGKIIWKRKSAGNTTYPLDDEMSSDSGRGRVVLKSSATPAESTYDLQPAADSGDGTVPVRSGAAPSGFDGVKACIPYPDIDHEGAYKKEPQQKFALWAVTKIVSNVKGTTLEYTK